VELDDVDARLPGDPLHLSRQGIDEHTDCQHGSVWGSFPSGGNAGSRRRRGNLPPRRRKYEPNQVGSGGSRRCGVLRFTQAADFHHTTASEEPSQRLLASG